MSNGNRIIEYDDYVTFKFSGPVTVEIIIEMAGRLMARGGFLSYRRLWDFRESGFTLSLDDLKKVADFVRQGDTASSRVAMLVEGDLSFGVSRMYEALRSTEGTAVMVFRDETKAVDWLRSND